MKNEETHRGKRVERSYRQTIEADADAVFPLLCPVRETEWLDGWDYRMVYSASGFAERGAVFSTSSPGEEDTVWIVTRHDAAERRVDFARFTPGCKTCLLSIAVTPVAASRCHVDITYAYTSIAPVGDAFLTEWTEEAFLRLMIFWERSMNHFLTVGGRLART